ncbi:hypothetical protein BGZ47_010480 [Haplosporangium gracile]|nr:hypothetical protein BGZ47_010480 [Haplosporangium gracile]
MDIPPPAALRKIAREVHAMVNDPPEGIRMILAEDISDIQAWIQGPEGTPYAGGYFRLRVQLNADFPNSPPKCFFVTKIFHPNVSKQGEVCVSTLKKDWKKTLGLKHILLVVKCLLIYPNPESALNEEAGRLLLERYDDYARHAVLMTGIHAQSAGKDAFPPTKRAGAEAQEGLKVSDLSSSLASATGEGDAETKDAVVMALAMKDIPKAGPERTWQGDEQSSTAASSTLTSLSLMSEFSSTTATTIIPTKRKLGSAENRTELEPANLSSSSIAACSSSSPFCSSTSTANSHGRPSATQQQQQPRTVLTAQRNSTSTAMASVQAKTQLNLLARQTLQGPPPAHRNQGPNMLQKQSASVSDQHNSQQQQEQQLPKDELCNSSNTHHMLSPKMAHNTLLGSTTTSTMTSVAVVTPRCTTVTAGIPSSSPVGQYHFQSALAGSCSSNFSLSQHSTTNTTTVTTSAAAAASMLRSSCLVAPHNLSSLSHGRPELHVDKKRALRRL